MRKPGVMPAGAVRVFETGAQRSGGTIDVLRYDLIPPVATRALARRFGIGTKYGEGNFLKGMTFSGVLYHVGEHLQKLAENAPDDDDTVSPIQAHGGAVMWGMAVLMEYERRGRTDLDDRLYTTAEAIPARVRAALAAAAGGPAKNLPEGQAGLRGRRGPQHDRKKARHRR